LDTSLLNFLLFAAKELFRTAEYAEYAEKDKGPTSALPSHTYLKFVTAFREANMVIRASILRRAWEANSVVLFFRFPYFPLPAA
jgi:hypothetical protein